MPELDTSELEDVVATPTDEQLKTISSLAERQIAAELNVEQCQAELNSAKAALMSINENLLPDAMQGCGLEMFKTTAGVLITIKEAMRASITEANRPSALSWLREHNHGSIIMNNVTVPFGGAEKTFEKELCDFLNSKGVIFDKKMSVHARTLQSWVKEQLVQGNDVPESISYYEQRISKVVK